MCAEETKVTLTSFACLTFRCNGTIQRTVELPKNGGYITSLPRCTICGNVYTESKYRDAPVSEESMKRFRDKLNIRKP